MRTHIALYTNPVLNVFMPRFEREGIGDSRGRGRPRDRGVSRGGRDFDDDPRGGGFRCGGFRGWWDSGRDNFERTKVICSSCNKECEVPFKPTSDKPVYCDDCFAKKGKGSSGKDFEVINEKLDKIMKALKIE